MLGDDAGKSVAESPQLMVAECVSPVPMSWKVTVPASTNVPTDVVLSAIGSMAGVASETVTRNEAVTP